MALPDPLPIQPFVHPVQGEIVLPGSKSVTNRALLLAALCVQDVSLSGALLSEDTNLMRDALQRLGLRITAHESGPDYLLIVSAQQKRFTPTEADLFVGLAGTAARFLTAFCAVAPQGIYRLDGVPQMRKRPMRGLIEALRTLGADIRCTAEEGFFPLVIHARGLRGGPVTIDAGESSQLLSALLMVAPFAQTPVEITLSGKVRWPFVLMTSRLMEQFGHPPIERRDEAGLRVATAQHYRLSAKVYHIEPDATAASYFLALPVVTGGFVELPGLNRPGRGLQGDTQFAAVLERVGLTLTDLTHREGLQAFVTTDAVRHGVTQDFSDFSDTFLTLAAIAPLLKGPTRITGIAHTRKQETDRVAGMARELRKLGQDVVEEEDALAITPRPLKSGVEIETYHDHRFAMSFAILGCHNLHGDGRPWLSIKDPGCCAKTFPHFFELLETLRRKSLAA